MESTEEVQVLPRFTDDGQGSAQSDDDEVSNEEFLRFRCPFANSIFQRFLVYLTYCNYYTWNSPINLMKISTGMRR